MWTVWIFKMLVLSVVQFGCLVLIQAHSKYVPQTPQVCRTMEPHHKVGPERSDAPYKVTVHAEKVQPGETISVSLVAEEARRQCRLSWGGLACHPRKDERGFKGFYIQARETRENRPVGKFHPKEDESVKVHNCGDGIDNAAFHGVKGHKTNVTLEWTAPKDFNGKVIFTTTFVKKYHKFWTDVKSGPVSVRLPYI